MYTAMEVARKDIMYKYISRLWKPVRQIFPLFFDLRTRRRGEDGGDPPRGGM